ncbi:hypothetical protein RF11_09700 [Thelohanellus kitauei]|uniref:Uncharacterized protein n=1 Tax=Thelohanellus kitauei TaxID=669202 RepID=A0A0C2N930_THEKT|nr:hypothetical protein RF11_09700 [Thelohanellus kitauei]
MDQTIGTNARNHVSPRFHVFNDVMENHWGPRPGPHFIRFDNHYFHPHFDFPHLPPMHYTHPLFWIVPLVVFSTLIGCGLFVIILLFLLWPETFERIFKRRRPAPTNVEVLRYDVENQYVTTHQSGYIDSCQPNSPSFQIDRI